MQEKPPRAPKKSETFSYDMDHSDKINLEVLDEAFEKKEINETEYNHLIRKLLQKREHTELHLSEIARTLSDEKDHLGIDAVTGLRKHEELEKYLSDQIQELNFIPTEENKGRHPPLQAIMVISVDLDNLRKWNNEISQTAGSKALRCIADKIRQATRDQDFAFRRGDTSDEIIIILRIEKDLKEEDIEKPFTHIKETINSGYVVVDGKKKAVTAAAGYILLRKGTEIDLKKVLEEADKNELRDKDPEVKMQRIRDAEARLHLEG